MFVDIAFNASSKEFKDKLDEAFDSARRSNVMPVIVGLDLDSSRLAKITAAAYKTVCFVGVHPLHFNNYKDVQEDQSESISILEFGESGVYLPADSSLLLKDILRQYLVGCSRIAGIGECGLDYYRKQNRTEQLAVFKAHLDLASEVDLPYFFHCRSAFGDFIRCIDSAPVSSIRGVVHSFDGTLEEAQEILKRGLYIGINGCSLRTEANCKVVQAIPIERILIETDSPYCLIRKSYFCSQFTTVIKARNNEPKHIGVVVEAIARIKSVSVEEVESIVYKNTIALFPTIAEYILEFMDLNKQ